MQKMHKQNGMHNSPAHDCTYKKNAQAEWNNSPLIMHNINIYVLLYRRNRGTRRELMIKIGYFITATHLVCMLPKLTMIISYHTKYMTITKKLHTQIQV